MEVRMKRLDLFVLCVVFSVALVTGCSKSSQGGPSGGQALSTFPVYSPSTVATVGKYDDSNEVTKLGSSWFETGATANHPFIGTQELLKTSASIDDLDAWLVKLDQSPPTDFTPNETPEQGTSAAPATGQPATPEPSPSPTENPIRDSLKIFGLVPSEYWSKDRGRVVMLIVFDPKKVADHLGPTMEVLDQYDKVPAFMRGALDETIKKQAGLSVSDLTSPNTPMGMIVYAARNWRNEDTRAIILVDATRQTYTLPTPHNT
jgi:hypothetical protein